MFAVPQHPRLLPFAAILLCLGALGLSPNEIALVVNLNNPDGMTLAVHYAAARHIPSGRIISLDIPNAEEIDFDGYERNVVPRIRDFLREHDLQKQVRCLVTFYGVPFRIRDRVDTPAEKEEITQLRPRLFHALDQIQSVVSQEEQLATSLDPTFQPVPKIPEASELQNVSRRSDAAQASASISIHHQPDLARRKEAMEKLLPLITQLGGPAVLNRLPPLGTAPSDQAMETRLEQLNQSVERAALVLARAEQLRYDPDARSAVRRISAQYFGLMQFAQRLESQIDYLTPGRTNAAFDNELALLWLSDYPRNGPLTNDLNFHIAGQLHMPMIMVSRLDGPNPQTVDQMIQTSIQVETQGLHGGMAINSFGFPNHPEGHAEVLEFDHRFHELARFVRDTTPIPVHQEYTRLYNNREIGPIALYCGWYSLRHYLPGMIFSPGAVGYHVASLEMVSLHGNFETGWVHGLLSDGVVATLGPVAEPYLGAFPPPGEFFPLLMTGQLTLAEVYWKTEPTASWMMCLVGDPLYTPYKMNPPLQPADLPPQLRYALLKPYDSSSRAQ